MQIKNRLNLLYHLGEYLQSNDPQLAEANKQANRQNPWFVPESIELSTKNIAEHFCKNNLENWLKYYQAADHLRPAKSVGIVMAGNIPLVGFHDLLCVFISGNVARVKLSSKDEVLLKHFVEK